MPLLTLPSVAMILPEPTARAVASPVPAVMAATLKVSDDHVASFVTSCVLPSLNVAVALNSCCAPKEMFALAGVTVMEFTVTDETVS